MDSTFDCKSSWVGTVSYMSVSATTSLIIQPERLKGESYFADTDIWSLGLVIMEAATGKFPLYNEDQSGDLTFWQLMKYLTEKDIPTLG